MEYVKYQVFLPDSFYDEFIAKVNEAGIEFDEGIHEAGGHQVLQTTANMGIAIRSYMIVFSAPLKEIGKLNQLLAQLVITHFDDLKKRYGIEQQTPDQLKSGIYKVYEKDKVLFYTIRHQLALSGHSLPEQEEVRLVDEYGLQYGLRSISIIPALVLAGIFVVLLVFNRVIGILPAAALCIYARTRKYKQQEMPDGRMEFLYDEPSRQKAGVLLAIGYILLGISVALTLLRLYTYLERQ
jgi:hypothetical protein